MVSDTVVWGNRISNEPRPILTYGDSFTRIFANNISERQNLATADIEASGTGRLVAYLRPSTRTSSAL